MGLIPYFSCQGDVFFILVFLAVKIPARKVIPECLPFEARLEIPSAASPCTLTPACAERASYLIWLRASSEADIVRAPISRRPQQGRLGIAPFGPAVSGIRAPEYAYARNDRNF
jgi:hypothetical protein